MAVIDEVLKLAVANGVTGRVAVTADPAAPEEPIEPAADPAFEQAEAALAAGDADGALAAYRSILERDPSNREAQASVARCELLLRIRDTDERAARTAAADNGDDVAAAITVADLDMATGHVEDAILRLVDLVRRTSGADRDQARAHLLSLFEVLDADDERVVKGRRSLANALF
jgi:putative thioredoxin